MQNPLTQEFIQLVSTEAPGLKVEAQSTRTGLETVQQFIVVGVSLGAFSGLWKVIELWVGRYANTTVKVTYEGPDGTTATVEYTKLTKAEVEKKLASLKLESPKVKVVISQPEDSGTMEHLVTDRKYRN